MTVTLSTDELRLLINYLVNDIATIKLFNSIGKYNEIDDGYESDVIMIKNHIELADKIFDQLVHQDVGLDKQIELYDYVVEEWLYIKRRHKLLAF